MTARGNAAPFQLPAPPVDKLRTVLPPDRRHIRFFDSGLLGDRCTVVTKIVELVNKLGEANPADILLLMNSRRAHLVTCPASHFVEI